VSAPGHRLRLTLRRDLLRLAGLACLTAAGAIEGLLLSQAPVLRDYSAVRLGPQGIFVSLPWLCVLGLAALGALGGMARWLRTLFLTLLAVPISWSLARSSQHPWWLLHASSPWHTESPTVGTLAGHALAIGLVCASAWVQALGRYRDAAHAQGMPVAQLASDTKRLGLRGTGLLAASVLAALLLPATLDPMASTLRGAVQGPAAFAVLLASAAALLVGLGLLAAPGTGRDKSGPT
jgi:hypothetical protein